MYTIVLVEDEKDLNSLISTYLEKAGYKVISFYNGEAYFVFNNWYSGKIDIYKYKGDLLPLKNNKNIKNDELILDNFKDMASNNALMYVISLVLVCLVSATIIFVGNRKLKV